MQVANIMGLFFFLREDDFAYIRQTYLVYFMEVEAIPCPFGRSADSVRTYTLDPKLACREFSRLLGLRFWCSDVGTSAAPRTGGSDVAHGPLCATIRRCAHGVSGVSHAK